VRFAFTDDQLAFRDAVADLLTRECPPEVVRGAWEGKPSDLWPKLAAMGVVGMTAPEEYGGLGMDELDLVLVLEEAGRAALPEPLLEHTAVAVPLLADAGGPLAQRWLPDAASGEAVLTIGLGPAPLIGDADRANAILDDHDGCVHVVETARCELTPRAGIDGAHRLFAVGWEATPDTKVEGSDPAAARERAALGAAAMLVGLADRMITMAADYARDRRQFGRPIGSYQAVQHRLADALMALEFSRPVVYRAAHSTARRVEGWPVHVSMAKAYASDAALQAARAALQVHGAIGYSWEHDLHLFMKRAWALAASWGDASWHRRRVAAAVLGGDAETDRLAP
jgi:alkylation response protein AidB-like acyl-CoA dehydrogenase